MDLTLLAILAVAIFVFRSPDLLQVGSSSPSPPSLLTALPCLLIDQCEDSAAALEGGQIKVLPLLQFFLFNENDS
jgi:hypothetical protein